MTYHIKGNFVPVILSYQTWILSHPYACNSEKRDFVNFSNRERVKNVFLSKKPGRYHKTGVRLGFLGPLGCPAMEKIDKTYKHSEQS